MKNPFSRNRIVVIAILGCSAVAASLIFLPLQSMNGTSYNTKYGQTPRAAIIDQLYDDYYNSAFESAATKDLMTAGYTVDIYTTKNVTVSFYKNLPMMGYKIIIIRSHASLSFTNNTGTASADLFTSESYSPDKYTLEQMLGVVDHSSYILLDYGVTHSANGGFSLYKRDASSGTFFSIGSKFVDEQMQGKFPGSIVVIGGCASLSNPLLADSLVKRGASAVIGWNHLVMADHNDNAMIGVLDSLLLNKSDIQDAVNSTMNKYGPDTIFSAVLRYYPPDAGGIRVG